MKHMFTVCFSLFGGGVRGEWGGGGEDEWALCFSCQVQYATVLNTVMDTYSN